MELVNAECLRMMENISTEFNFKETVTRLNLCKTSMILTVGNTSQAELGREQQASEVKLIKDIHGHFLKYEAHFQKKKCYKVFRDPDKKTLTIWKWGVATCQILLPGKWYSSKNLLIHFLKTLLAKISLDRSTIH